MWRTYGLTSAVFGAVGTAVLAGAAATFADAPPGANYWGYVPPTIIFTSDDSSITATIRNPNDKGFCFAAIGIPGDTGVHDPNDHSGSMHIFGEDHDAPWPAAQQSSTITHRDLPPALYSVSGWCADSETSVQRSDQVTYQVRVGSVLNPSSGSLVFGS